VVSVQIRFLCKQQRPTLGEELCYPCCPIRHERLVFTVADEIIYVGTSTRSNVSYWDTERTKKKKKIY